MLISRQLFVVLALVAVALAGHGHVFSKDSGVQYQFDNQKTAHGYAYPSHIVVPSGSYKFLGGHGGGYHGGYGGFGYGGFGHY